MSDIEKKVIPLAEERSIEESSITTVDVRENTIKRALSSRNINLIAIGGSIATSLFITISTGLLYGGPLSLFLAFFLWSFVIFFVVVAMGEMVCYLPIEAPFIQMAGRCVDKAFEFTVGINYVIMTSLFIPFEITACNSMIHYWRDDYNPAISFCVQIVIYTALNVFAVKYFGESEFYLSLGKLLLAVALIFFTFITMVGGNPLHDAFGFRYWKTPGPMVASYATGSLGRIHGFMVALNRACIVVAGPEYLCMVAGETGQETRKVLSKTFKSVFFRLIIFYVFGALCVGILVASNDPTLVELASKGSTSNAAYSPYVIAMNNLKIKVFPDIVNALCVSSAFSAGNSYVFCSSRALYGMAQRGLVPSIFKRCTKNGVPIYGIAVGICFSLLSLFQLNSNSAKVLWWMIDIGTTSQVLNFFFMCITYLGFYYSCEAQNIDKSNFTYRAWFQPYLTYFTGFVLLCMAFALGYSVFLPGHWDLEMFLTSYIMIFVCIVSFIGYKLIFRTKFVKSSEADLITGLREIEEHELNYLASLKEENTKTKRLISRVNRFLF